VRKLNARRSLSGEVENSELEIWRYAQVMKLRSVGTAASVRLLLGSVGRLGPKVERALRQGFVNPQRDAELANAVHVQRTSWSLRVLLLAPTGERFDLTKWERFAR
jgi:hypothetical protein